MMTCYYYPKEYVEENIKPEYVVDNYHQFQLTGEVEDPLYYTEEIAEDFWDNHDGWDYDPNNYELAVFNKDGIFLAVLDVNIETVPSFDVRIKR